MKELGIDPSKSNALTSTGKKRVGLLRRAKEEVSAKKKKGN